MIYKNAVSKDHLQVNDTLQKLLSFEFADTMMTNDVANEALEYLIKIKLHHSAYNWISGEFVLMEHKTWKKSNKVMIDKLSTKKSEKYIQPWFSDTNK
jgi:hypothetical protein